MSERVCEELLFSKVISVVALAASLMEGSMDAAIPDKDVDSTFYLINRQHEIHENYVPETRKVNVTGMSQTMRDDAATALEEMFEAAKQESNISLASVSGYRSYSRQSAIYARKRSSAGKAKADLLVALPGTSEHQLGLAMDVARKGSSQLNSSFGKTKEGIWVKENAHRFGFVIRYQEEWVDITGYSYEPWHIRYVGKGHAQAMFEANVPMEIYVSAHRLEIYDFLIHLSLDEVDP